MKKTRVLFILIAIFAGLNTFAINVTFKVDMAQQTVPPEGVHIAGSFQGWDPGATVMTMESGTVYFYSADFTEGETIEYKFINGDEWGEDESVPPECNQNNNRFLVIPAEDIILEAVCFGTCEPCGTPAEVTFQVDMSEQTLAPEGIHVAGNFQGWNPASTELLPIGDNIYAITIMVSENQYLEFKYINGNDWPGEEVVPEACGVPDGVAGFNRSYTVPVGGGTMEALCFSSCEPCGFIPTEVEVTFSVDMSQETVSPYGVHITGEFQGWDPAANAMTDMGDGLHQTTITLYEGDHHQYKFINGNTWDDEEIVPQECGEDNGQGGFNRFINVPGENIILDTVCYSSCSPCGFVPVEVFVTFKVDMSLETVSSEGVFLVSDFQGWDPTANPMNINEQGVYEATFMVYEGDHHQYKFINGNTWDDEEIVPAECGEDNGQGGYNRFIDVPEETFELPVVCFASCEPCNLSIQYQRKDLDQFFKVSPNPFTDELNIMFNGRLATHVNLEILNVYGQVKLKADIENMPSNYACSSGELAEGVYFCRIEYLNGKNTVTELIKVIKQ